MAFLRPVSSAYYCSGEIAQKLNRSSDWFYRHRRDLAAAGMPQPAALPGQPRWIKTEIDLWLIGKNLRTLAGRTALPAAPANDAVTPPPAERDSFEEHRRALADAYRRRA